MHTSEIKILLNLPSINALNSVHDNITFTKELECGDSLAFLDVLIEKSQTGIQTTTYRKPTHSGLYTHWTSFIPHYQKRNLVFGLLDRAYKIASTYNAIHSEFMNIKSMLIKNGYPKAYLNRCIMKYLNKKHETSINSFTEKPPMTTTISMRLPYVEEISYVVRREMQRLVHRYAITPFQFRYVHESNKLKKIFYIQRQTKSFSSLKCSLQTNMHMCVKLHWTDSPKFINPNQRTQIWSTFWSL